LGDLNFKPEIIRQIEQSSSAQLVNEYGWIWLWRNGTPSKLTVDVYNYYLGSGSTAFQNRELQAYWLQLETEWLRSNASIAGVLAFCYLANNYGYTGDWFIDDIKDLKPGLSMQWFRHCFAPSAVFINLTDERYTKHVTPHIPGSDLMFDLAGINNKLNAVSGKLIIRIIDSNGKDIKDTSSEITLEPLTTKRIFSNIALPEHAGGYLLLAEFTSEGETHPVVSRRYIKVGQSDSYEFFDLQPESLK
jgi:hypothetical protein